MLWTALLSFLLSQKDLPFLSWQDVSLFPACPSHSSTCRLSCVTDTCILHPGTCDECQQGGRYLLGLISCLAVTEGQQRTKGCEKTHAHVISSNLTLHYKLQGSVYKNRSVSTHICYQLWDPVWFQFNSWSLSLSPPSFREPSLNFFPEHPPALLEPAPNYCMAQRGLCDGAHAVSPARNPDYLEDSSSPQSRKKTSIAGLSLIGFNSLDS